MKLTKNKMLDLIKSLNKEGAQEISITSDGSLTVKFCKPIVVTSCSALTHTNNSIEGEINESN